MTRDTWWALGGAGSAGTSLSSPPFDAQHVNISCSVSTHSCKGSRQPFTCQRAAIKTRDGCVPRPPSSRCFDTDFQQEPQIRLPSLEPNRISDISSRLLSAAPDVLRHSAPGCGLRTRLVRDSSCGRGWGGQGAQGGEMKLPKVAPRLL